jgi:hypothetical protein
MKRRHKTTLYTTETAQDLEEGWSALELHRADGAMTQVVARIVFWDAEGQFALETTASHELPLDVVQEFIDEARSTIRVK